MQTIISAPPSSASIDYSAGSIRDYEPVEFAIRNGRVVPLYKCVKRDTPKGVGFVDQISFTFINDFYKNVELRHRVACWGGGTGWNDSDELVNNAVNAMLRHVFGITVEKKRAFGANFYRDSFMLADGCGMVSIGGQSATILIQLTGAALGMAAEGWQERLSDLVQVLTRFVITRLDVAYDDYEGLKYQVSRAQIDYENHLFTGNGRRPSCEQRGNWLFPDGKGRTFYVGKREHGKMLRVYEKGCQLGEMHSPWVRVELELHNKGRIILFDAVLNPGAYLAGSYEALEWCSNGEQHRRIATAQKSLEISYDHAVRFLVRSYGGLLNLIKNAEAKGLSMLDALIADKPIPNRVNVPLTMLMACSGTG